MIAMAMVIPVAAIAAPTNKREADFRSAPGGRRARAARTKQGRGPEGPPAPALVLRAGGPKAPRPAKRRRPPGAAGISRPLPVIHKPPYPKRPP